MRIGPTAARRYYKTTATLIKYPQTFHPLCPPFLQGAKFEKNWPKLTPIVFGPLYFWTAALCRKTKTTCQGRMIGLLLYQTWDGWVPQLPELLAQWVPKRVKVENFWYILRSSGPRPAGSRQYYTNSEALGCAHKISTDIRPMLPFLRGGKCPKLRPNRLRTAVFLNGSTLSEIINKLGKDRW